MKPCRKCRHEISKQAMASPQCGATFPAKEKRDGWGFEYKSKAIFGEAYFEKSRDIVFAAGEISSIFDV